jgi:hypothetical protein
MPKFSYQAPPLQSPRTASLCSTAIRGRAVCLDLLAHRGGVSLVCDRECIGVCVFGLMFFLNFGRNKAAGLMYTNRVHWRAVQCSDVRGAGCRAAAKWLYRTMGAAHG